MSRTTDRPPCREGWKPPLWRVSWRGRSCTLSFDRVGVTHHADVHRAGRGSFPHIFRSAATPGKVYRVVFRIEDEPRKAASEGREGGAASRAFPARGSRWGVREGSASTSPFVQAGQDAARPPRSNDDGSGLPLVVGRRTMVSRDAGGGASAAVAQATASKRKRSEGSTIGGSRWNPVRDRSRSSRGRFPTFPRSASPDADGGP